MEGTLNIFILKLVNSVSNSIMRVLAYIASFYFIFMSIDTSFKSMYQLLVIDITILLTRLIPYNGIFSNNIRIGCYVSIAKNILNFVIVNICLPRMKLNLNIYFITMIGLCIVNDGNLAYIQNAGVVQLNKSSKILLFSILITISLCMVELLRVKRHEQVMYMLHSIIGSCLINTHSIVDLLETYGTSGPHGNSYWVRYIPYLKGALTLLVHIMYYRIAYDLFIQHSVFSTFRLYYMLSSFLGVCQSLFSLVLTYLFDLWVRYTCPPISSKSIKQLDSIGERCAVCLCEHDDTSVSLPCQHIIHKECLVNMLRHENRDVIDTHTTAVVVTNHVRGASGTNATTDTSIGRAGGISEHAHIVPRSTSGTNDETGSRSGTQEVTTVFMDLTRAEGVVHEVFADENRTTDANMYSSVYSDTNDSDVDDCECLNDKKKTSIEEGREVTASANANSSGSTSAMDHSRPNPENVAGAGPDVPVPHPRSKLLLRSCPVCRSDILTEESMVDLCVNVCRGVFGLRPTSAFTDSTASQTTGAVGTEGDSSSPTDPNHPNPSCVRRIRSNNNIYIDMEVSGDANTLPNTNPTCINANDKDCLVHSHTVNAESDPDDAQSVDDMGVLECNDDTVTAHSVLDTHSNPSHGNCVNGGVSINNSAQSVVSPAAILNTSNSNAVSEANGELKNGSNGLGGENSTLQQGQIDANSPHSEKSSSNNSNSCSHTHSSVVGMDESSVIMPGHTCVVVNDVDIYDALNCIISDDECGSLDSGQDVNEMLISVDGVNQSQYAAYIHSSGQRYTVPDTDTQSNIASNTENISPIQKPRERLSWSQECEPMSPRGNSFEFSQKYGLQGNQLKAKLLEARDQDGLHHRRDELTSVTPKSNVMCANTVVSSKTTVVEKRSVGENCSGHEGMLERPCDSEVQWNRPLQNGVSGAVVTPTASAAAPVRDPLCVTYVPSSSPTKETITECGKTLNSQTPPKTPVGIATAVPIRNTGSISDSTVDDVKSINKRTYAMYENKSSYMTQSNTKSDLTVGVDDGGGIGSNSNEIHATGTNPIANNNKTKKKRRKR